jgi:hypothetical protein
MQFSALPSTIIPDIQQNICSSSHRQTLKRILLHFDNASAYSLRLSSEKIESTKAEILPHRPHSPDQTEHQVTSSVLVI